MERLIYSSCSSSFLLKPNILIHGGGRSDTLPILRRRLKPVTAFWFSRQESQFPSAASSSHPSTCKKSSNFTPFLRNSDDDKNLNRKCNYPSADSASGTLRKVTNAIAVVLLSALTITSIQSIISPAANATTLQSAVSTGGLVRAELLTSAWTGFLAGCLHTLSGPDHLAALAPLSIGRTSLESAAVGALWGCGHDAGQMIFGLIFLLLKDRLHIEIIRTWGTRVVGLTLLVIGGMGIREASEVPAPCVALESGTQTLEGPPSGKKKIGFATFATGIVHGLQPDALLMVLPALALPSRLAGAAFLGMFLVGTVIAMGSYTVFIGSCSQALKGRIPRITEKLTWAAFLLAISMGIAILVSQFFGFSLY